MINDAMQGKRERRLTAYHEAGHILLYWLTGQGPRGCMVYAKPRKGALGMALGTHEAAISIGLVGYPCLCVAGYAAECVLHRWSFWYRQLVFDSTYQRILSSECDENDDLPSCIKAIKWLMPDNLTKTTAMACLETARSLLLAHWDEVRQIAEVLFKKDKMSRAEVGKILLVGNVPTYFDARPISRIQNDLRELAIRDKANKEQLRLLALYLNVPLALADER